MSVEVAVGAAVGIAVAIGREKAKSVIGKEKAKNVIERKKAKSALTSSAGQEISRVIEATIAPAEREATQVITTEVPRE